MTERGRTRAIRRILIGIDASRDSLAALEMAARLAAGLRAELAGLYVEDINLLRLARLPFACEISTFSATVQPLNPRQVELSMRVQAAQARRAIRAAAERASVRASFQVTRGQVATELLNAAREADVLILGRVSRPVTRRLRLGSTARAAAERAGSLLLSHQGEEQGVMVTYDGSEASKQALEAAATIAAPDHELTVLLVAADDKEAEALAKQAERWLSVRLLGAEFQRLADVSLERVIKAIDKTGCGLLVLAGDTLHLSAADLRQLLDETDCSVMVIREV